MISIQYNMILYLLGTGRNAVRKSFLLDKALFAITKPQNETKMKSFSALRVSRKTPWTSDKDNNMHMKELKYFSSAF